MTRYRKVTMMIAGTHPARVLVGIQNRSSRVSCWDKDLLAQTLDLS